MSNDPRYPGDDDEDDAQSNKRTRLVMRPDVAESRYGGDPVVVSSADAFVLLVVPFTDRYGRR